MRMHDHPRLDILSRHITDDKDVLVSFFSLEAIGNLWAEWGIHGMILVSFGLQVFLFFAAGARRHNSSCYLGWVLWLAYLSADYVAIFVLGHLAIYASGPQHQLLFFWAPFVLLHLGGQHTITAFAMQDNELWGRHLLGLVNQVVVACYVVSRSSWPDRWLLAAMVLMLLSGCWRYAERTLCLYKASPGKLKESSLVSLRNYARNVDSSGYRPFDDDYKRIIAAMLNAEGRRFPYYAFDEISSSATALVSETPLNAVAAVQAPTSVILEELGSFKSNKDRCRAYNYVAAELRLIYERLYTKIPLHSALVAKLFDCSSSTISSIIPQLPERCVNSCWFPIFAFSFYFSLLLSYILVSLVLLFPLLSSLATLVLFVAAKKVQLYNQADVIVSYILLVGAIILEALSLFIFIQSFLGTRDIFQCARKQWSEELVQYNMIKSMTRQNAGAGIMSFVTKCISKHLPDKMTLQRIPIHEDLKKSVLDKLLDFGIAEDCWNFASFRGQLALRDRKKGNRHAYLYLFNAKSETPLEKSIHDVEFPTSVLIWHIATDILYFQDDTNTQMKKLSRELSNYIMYLVFKCGVLLTSRSELLYHNALVEMKKVFEQDTNLCEEEAMNKVFEDNKGHHHTWRSSEKSAQTQRLKNTSETLASPLLPRACEVAQELIGIEIEADRWNLIAMVWLEMLYYTAPRCGGAFHSEHLATGGEFITQVLILMQFLGPFLPASGA